MNLARMLRYVSSTEATTATLGTEIEYAESYLAGMRARFGDSLEYVIEVRPEMRQIVVPAPDSSSRSSRTASSTEPQRVLPGASSAGSRADGRWSTVILDNGPGFTAETMARISERLAPAARGVAAFPEVLFGNGNRQFLRKAEACLRRWSRVRDHRPTRWRRANRDRGRFHG